MEHALRNRGSCLWATVHYMRPVLFPWVLLWSFPHSDKATRNDPTVVKLLSVLRLSVRLRFGFLVRK